MPAPMSPKTRARDGPRDPQLRGRDLTPARDDRVGEPDLPVELERSRLHGDRARGRPGLGGLVDDPDADPESREPERQHETGRPCAGDEHLPRCVGCQKTRPIYSSGGEGAEAGRATA